MYQAASGLILEELNGMLTSVETAWQQETGLDLYIRKATTLGEARNTVVGIPKTYFRRRVIRAAWVQPMIAQHPDLPAGLLNPLLRLGCSELILWLWNDPN